MTILLVLQFIMSSHYLELDSTSSVRYSILPKYQTILYRSIVAHQWRRGKMVTEMSVFLVLLLNGWYIHVPSIVCNAAGLSIQLSNALSSIVHVYGESLILLLLSRTMDAIGKRTGVTWHTRIRRSIIN